MAGIIKGDRNMDTVANRMAQEIAQLDTNWTDMPLWREELSMAIDNGNKVKVWSDEEVRELRSGHWAAMLDAQEGDTVAYLRFESYSDRQEWVEDMPNLRIYFPAHSVPLSLLLDRQAWSEKVVNLSAKRKAKVLFANH